MDDPYDLQRFVDAHEQAYSSAIAEIRAGRKRSHWMWFIFPQFAGLGSSAMSQRYAIRSSQEAKAYLLHPQLGERLIACAESLLALHGLTCQQIFGAPDDMKLRSRRSPRPTPCLSNCSTSTSAERATNRRCS